MKMIMIIVIMIIIKLSHHARVSASINTAIGITSSHLGRKDAPKMLWAVKNNS